MIILFPWFRNNKLCNRLKASNTRNTRIYYILTTSLCAFSFLCIYGLQKLDIFSWKSKFIVQRHKMWLICNGGNNGWKILTQGKNKSRISKILCFFTKRISLNSSKREHISSWSSFKKFCVLLFSNLSSIHMKWPKYISLSYVHVYVRVFVRSYLLANVWYN